MWKTRVLIASLVAVPAVTASAQPSFDCSKARAEAEELICSDEALATLDKRLADRFSDAIAKAGMAAGDEKDAENTLRAMQRGWIKGRDECWKSDDMRRCIKAAYQTREAELVATWMLQEPTAVARYNCEDTAANEVVVFYFDTEMQSIRLEYGDSIRPGWRVPAASGSKYETTFGGLFWTMGEEALFVWMQGQEMNCNVVD